MQEISGEDPVSSAEGTSLVPGGDAESLGDLVTGQLQRLEIAMLGRVLTTTLAGALPPSIVSVENRRSIGDRIAGRPGVVVGVRLQVEDQRLSFRVPDIGSTEATISHVVAGVVLSTRQVSVAEWLAALGKALDKLAAEDRATRVALERALLA